MSFRRSLPIEHPAGPMSGHKLAYPMLSADGGAAAFGGIWSDAQPVYRVRDTAACFWKPQHRPPERRCGCGFYCLHTLDAARAMACEAQYRSTVILDVDVFGRFIRQEKGFRYSDQRVRGMHLNRCSCGRPARLLVDSGGGVTGWLRLHPCCPECSASKKTLSPSQFAALLGEPALERVDLLPGDGTPDDAPTADPGSETSLSVLRAEVALLQARVDRLELQLSRLT